MKYSDKLVERNKQKHGNRIIVAICIIIIILLLVFAAIYYFYYLPSKATPVITDTPIAEVEYLNSFLVINEDGYYIRENTEDSELPNISNLDISSAIINEKVVTIRDDSLPCLLTVLQYARTIDLTGLQQVEFTDDGYIYAYFGRLKVILDSDSNAINEMKDLKAFYEELLTETGTLDMRTGYTAENEYVFRKNVN